MLLDVAADSSTETQHGGFVIMLVSVKTSPTQHQFANRAQHSLLFFICLEYSSHARHAGLMRSLKGLTYDQHSMPLWKPYEP